MRRFILILSIIITHFAFSETLKTCDSYRLQAESSLGSRPQGLMIHRGNVSYCDTKIALSSEELKIQRQKDNSTVLTAIGNPVSITQFSDSFSFDAKSLKTEYLPDQKSLSFTEQVVLNLKTQQRRIQIKTDTLKYTFKDSDTLKPDELIAHGSPIQFSLSEDGAQGLEATAENLVYVYETGILTLSGNVEFKQASDIIRAEKLIYNTADKSWEVPAIKNKRIEMIKKPDS